MMIQSCVLRIKIFYAIFGDFLFYLSFNLEEKINLKENQHKRNFVLSVKHFNGIFEFVNLVDHSMEYRDIFLFALLIAISCCLFILKNETRNDSYYFPSFLFSIAQIEYIVENTLWREYPRYRERLPNRFLNY